MSLIAAYNDVTHWKPTLQPDTQRAMSEALETGHVAYFPNLAHAIAPEKQMLLSEQFLAEDAKNISYNPHDHSYKGINATRSGADALKQLIRDFSEQAHQLVQQLFPHYQEALRIGRTSFRPAEIEGRKTSYRKDDTRLHVDAFPSMPLQGERILRFFCNVNPNNKPRVWHLGEKFDQVMEHFGPYMHPPLVGAHSLLKLFGLTKKKRTLYDHYMLSIHNSMKRDETYQKSAIQEKMEFPSNSSWIVFTDLVSHAALSGQHLLEQTFYLPAEKQLKPDLAPLKKLENYLQRSLLTA